MATPNQPATLFNPGPHSTPAGTGAFGMMLFLLALVMLFAGSLAAYIYIRLTATDAPPMGTIHLPWGLWVSTFIILASSVTMHRALQAVRSERQTQFRQMLTLTLVLAIGFLLVQTPSLMQIVREHLPKLEEYRAARQAAVEQVALTPTGRNTVVSAGVPMPLEGLVFILILVHALHVIGGVIPLINVTLRAHQGRYDHERHGPVQYVTMYWHFLDAVWIVMFGVLLLAS